MNPLSIDLTAFKTVDVFSRKMDLGLQVFNLTNHFNPRDVHANIADPQFGQFRASSQRYVTGGFDLLF